jgi:capsular polysaccharide transport system permease protein
VSSLLRGLVVQGEVVHAVILRETRTRFGAHRLGYLWALLEPSIVILTFWFLYRVAGRVPPAGMDLFSFVATGVIPYTLFASSAHRVAEAVNGNKGLLNYPQVMPIDLAIARCLLELVTYAAVFIVLMGIHALWVRDLRVDQPLTVILGFALASLLGSTLGLVFCGLGQWNNTVDRARGPLLRPLFWLSGVFYTADALPLGARKGLLANPVLQVNEMVRDGWFESYTTEHADPLYIAQWILFLALAGLMLERWVRRRIEVT